MSNKIPLPYYPAVTTADKMTVLKALYSRGLRWGHLPDLVAAEQEMDSWSTRGDHIYVEADRSWGTITLFRFATQTEIDASVKRATRIRTNSFAHFLAYLYVKDLIPRPSTDA